MPLYAIRWTAATRRPRLRLDLGGRGLSFDANASPPKVEHFGVELTDDQVASVRAGGYEVVAQVESPAKETLAAVDLVERSAGRDETEEEVELAATRGAKKKLVTKKDEEVAS